MNIGELAKFRGGIATDTISEQTAASGVTIDSVLCKDGSVTCAASGTVITTYVKAADTQGLVLVNSSGTSVVTVTDAGAVTAGRATPGAVDIVNTIRGYYLELDNRKTAATQAYFRFKAGGSQMGAIGATTTNCFELWNAADNAKNVECSNAGAWTLGPAAGLGTSVVHVMNGSTNTGTQVIEFVKKTGADSASNYFLSCKAGTGTTEQGGLWNNASGDFTTFTNSDIRIKSDIRDANYGLNEVLALRPRLFTKDGIPNVKGFIAQEVKDIIPESVGIRESNGISDFHVLETQTMIPVLVAAMKEQQAIIEELKAEVAALKAK